MAAKNIFTPLLIFGISAFLAVGIFGMSYASDMNMKGDGTMSGCLFDGRAEICPMTFAEHLSHWQGMFTAIPQKANLFVMLLALILVVGALAFFILKQHQLLLLKYFLDRWRLYLKQNPHILSFHHLREAFSQGILNPKIYASVSL
ncbi:MAG: hypothetical protein HYT82_00330 [Candidatus Harrisonbacteria bacterium]|nr:hypothetical protein [Candidatus Harrisonbacteria bacterium]